MTYQVLISLENNTIFKLPVINFAWPFNGESYEVYNFETFP